MSEKVTAKMICNALANNYTSPEWYLAFEVGDSTGAECSRHADAVAINAYPSKGFETRGFEIKVAKSDLKSELDNGIKSDAIARYCDYWFLVVPKGLADDFTLPPTWGVIEYHDGKLRQKIRATKLTKIAPSAGFMCALMRGRERLVYANAEKITKNREEQLVQSASWRARSDKDELERLKEKLKEIHTATGVALDKWTPTESVIEKLHAVHALRDITRGANTLKYVAKELADCTAKIIAAVDEINGNEKEKAE